MAADSRILWLHSHFELPTGGTKYIYEVVRRVAEVQPIEVIVESASSLWRERYAEAGVPLHELGGATSTSLGYWAAFPVFLKRDLDGIEQRVGPSTTTLVASFFPMPWLASRVARRHSLRHVSLCFEPFPFFHDDEVMGMYPPLKRFLLHSLHRAYGWVDHAGIASADALVTLNPSTQHQIARVYGRTDSICAYAGVDTELFRPYGAEEVADLAARFGAGPLVIHSTDFSPIKRTDLALRAFAMAAEIVPEARLVITSTRTDPVAEGDMRRLAESLGVLHRVVFAGFLPFVDLPRLYSLATVLLQTGTSVGSGATTMSLPVKEALACGTPVVRSGATDEDVEDAVSGFLVDPTDSPTVGARLAELLGDPPRALEMGLAGRARIERTYTWSRVVDVLMDAVSA